MSLSGLKTLISNATNGQPSATPPPPPLTVAYSPNKNLRDDDNVAVTAFPLEIFPERIQQVVKDCERFMSFPSDLTAAGILAATALSIGRTHQV